MREKHPLASSQVILGFLLRKVFSTIVFALRLTLDNGDSETGFEQIDLPLKSYKVARMGMAVLPFPPSTSSNPCVLCAPRQRSKRRGLTRIPRSENLPTGKNGKLDPPALFSTSRLIAPDQNAASAVERSGFRNSLRFNR